MAGIFTKLAAEKYLETYRPPLRTNPRLHADEGVKATLERGWADVREVVVSADAAQERPKEVDFHVLDIIVRLGYVSGLIILLDADEYLDFIPKITRLLSYSHQLRTLRLFSDQLPQRPLLPFYARPNILDSLPPRLEALTLEYAIIARVLIRARNLVALKIEGARLLYEEPHAKKDQWKTYIGCKLRTLVLRWMSLRIHTLRDILSKSGRSLETLHIEMVREVRAEEVGQLIGLCFPYLERLTVIDPPAGAAVRSGSKLELVLDSATKVPMLSCKYLYAEGLCLSKNSFLLPENARGFLVSQWPLLSVLTLHDCEKFSAADLFRTIYTGGLPQLRCLEAMWPRVRVSDSSVPGEMAARMEEYNQIRRLIQQCSSTDRSGVQLAIVITAPMSNYYQDVIRYWNWLVRREREAEYRKEENEENEAANALRDELDRTAAHAANRAAEADDWQ